MGDMKPAKKNMALMIAMLNLFGFERKPSLYWVSVLTYSGVLRTVDTMITFEIFDQSE